MSVPGRPRPAGALVAMAVVGALLAGTPASGDDTSRFMQASGPFETHVLRAIYAIIPFDRTWFVLDRDRPARFALYGADAPLDCRRSVAFSIIAGESEAGSIGVGVCDEHAARVRDLAGKARPGLEDAFDRLARAAPGGFDRGQACAAGWCYEETRSPDGAELHSFPVLLVGHGVIPVPTVLLLRGTRAVVVQAGAFRFCAARRSHALCADTKGVLGRLARDVAASVP